MTHKRIADIVKVPNDLLEMDVEEVAGVLLVHFNSSAPSNRNMYSYHDGSGRFNQNSFSNGLLQEPPYPSHKVEVRIALLEAWGWLHSAALLISDRDLWSFLSRRALRLATLDDFQHYQYGRLLPKNQIHPLIASRVYPAFLRGAYDTAIFEAFREVEIAVRVAAKIADGTTSNAVITAAFRVSPPGPLADTTIPAAEQAAMLSIFNGVMGFYRNSSGHRHVPRHPEEAVEVIMFASQLLRIVDKLKP